MKSWMKRAIEVFAAGTVLVGAGLLLSGWGFDSTLGPAMWADASPLLETRAAVPLEEHEGVPAVEPRSVALMLGWRPPLPPPAPVPPAAVEPEAPPEPEPTPISWLRYVGYVADQRGLKRFIFKDDRLDRMVSLTAGGTKDGWTLVEAQPDRFLLEREEGLFVVERE